MKFLDFAKNLKKTENATTVFGILHIFHLHQRASLCLINMLVSKASLTEGNATAELDFSSGGQWRSCAVLFYHRRSMDHLWRGITASRPQSPRRPLCTPTRVTRMTVTAACVTRFKCSHVHTRRSHTPNVQTRMNHPYLLCTVAPRPPRRTAPHR